MSICSYCKCHIRNDHRNFGRKRWSHWIRRPYVQYEHRCRSCWWKFSYIYFTKSQYLWNRREVRYRSKRDLSNWICYMIFRLTYGWLVTTQSLCPGNEYWCRSKICSLSPPPKLPPYMILKIQLMHRKWYISLSKLKLQRCLCVCIPQCTCLQYCCFVLNMTDGLWDKYITLINRSTEWPFLSEQIIGFRGLYLLKCAIWPWRSFSSILFLRP